MNLEPDAIQIDAQEASIPLPFPQAWWGRVFYGLFVAVLPAFSFWATDLLKPEWQNGQLSSYIILLLFPQASIFFFPLLAYSIICYLLLLYMPARFSQSFIVRAGIYTGALLALQYSIVVLLYALYEPDSFIYALIPVWILPFVYSRLHRWAVSKWTAVKVNKALFILVLGGSLISALITTGGILFLIMVGLTMAAPFWSFLLALRTGIWLCKNHETKLIPSHGIGLAAWITTYVAAWRYDILRMYELYAALPPQPPPDCYIATAAAHGHTKLVRSWTVQLADGKFMRVNEQLQTLKCAELALKAVAPRVHKFARKIYDVGGKRLAREIRNPLMADFAYLLLKPFEWMAKFCLRFIIGNVRSRSIGMYSK